MLTPIKVVINMYVSNLLLIFSGFLELSADLVEAAIAHCQLIVVSK